MRTGRNRTGVVESMKDSLDHWDMRTGRNNLGVWSSMPASLDHWDMRTGRNTEFTALALTSV